MNSPGSARGPGVPQQGTTTPAWVALCAIDIASPPDTRSPRKTKNQEPRTKNQEPRTKNQEPRTKNQEPRTKNQEPRTKNQLNTLPHLTNSAVPTPFWTALARRRHDTLWQACPVISPTNSHQLPNQSSRPVPPYLQISSCLGVISLCLRVKTTHSAPAPKHHPSERPSPPSSCAAAKRNLTLKT